MTTDAGNTDPIPSDIAGRVLWAAKHFGTVTVVGCVLWWQSNEFIGEQRRERIEQGQYMREVLIAINKEAVAVITRANVCMESQVQESRKTREATEETTAAVLRLCDRLREN